MTIKSGTLNSFYGWKMVAVLWTLEFLNMGFPFAWPRTVNDVLAFRENSFFDCYSKWLLEENTIYKSYTRTFELNITLCLIGMIALLFCQNAFAQDCPEDGSCFHAI